MYFYELGTELGIDRIAFFARGLGLGRPSGLRLPHEQPGLVPTEAWKERRFREPWLSGETVSASIGQGFNLVTPLQIAVTYAAIANGGILLRPRLLLDAGEGAFGVRPEAIGRVPVSDSNLAFLRSALESAVQGDSGTGARARVPGVRVGGKTGTAQVVGLRHTEDLEDDEVKLRHRDHAWFVGFAPVEAPEIVVAAIMMIGNIPMSNNAHVTPWKRTTAAYAKGRLRFHSRKPMGYCATQRQRAEAPDETTAVAPAATDTRGGRDVVDG